MDYSNPDQHYTMKIRIRKDPEFTIYKVEVKRWYWPFWTVTHRLSTMTRAQEVAAEIHKPVIVPFA